MPQTVNKISDQKVLKIIFTDPVWLKNHKHIEQGAIIGLYNTLNGKEEKKAFAKSLNHAMYAASMDLTSNYNLDDQGGTQWLIDRILPKKINSDGSSERNLSVKVWGTAIILRSWIHSWLPRKSDTGRGLDSLFAWLYAGLHVFGRNADGIKKDLVCKGSDGKNQIDTKVNDLPCCFGLKDKPQGEDAHGEFFDDISFASFYLNENELGNTSLEDIYGKIKQTNYSDALEILGQFSSARNHCTKSDDSYFFYNLLSGSGLDEEENGDFRSMLLSAFQRA